MLPAPRLDTLVFSVSRGKRRRPASREGGRESQGTGIPAPLALSMLSHLLGGGKGHASTVAARDAIMADDGAVGSLEVRRRLMGGGCRGRGGRGEEDVARVWS